MLRISNKSKVYIACPPNKATGGPELLHQLASKLSKIDVNAVMFYFPIEKNVSPIHENYSKYVENYVFEITDNEENVLIVPETRTSILKRYNKIQKVIWWLSVDNYSVNYNSHKNRLKRILGYNDFFNINKISHRNDVNLHLVQSKYAELYLKKYKINSIEYLTDYIRSDYLNEQDDFNEEYKEDIVLYNPLKGFSFTKKLIENSIDIRWVPIINLKPEELKILISKSKVYIDFGNHPGKDRLPRECALLRCCIITGKRGSAANDSDISIPSKFKFNDSVENIEEILFCIKDCLNNYSHNVSKFESYRKEIVQQEKRFEFEVSKIFNKNEFTA